MPTTLFRLQCTDLLPTSRLHKTTGHADEVKIKCKAKVGWGGLARVTRAHAAMIKWDPAIATLRAGACDRPTVGARAVRAGTRQADP